MFCLDLELLDYRDSIIQILQEGAIRSRYFDNYRKYSIEIIKEIGMNMNFSEKIKHVLANEDEVFKYLHLLMIEGIVTKDIILSSSNTYQYVPKRLQDSSYTKNYYNLKGNFPNKILLISDTHLGSETVQDYSLIRTIFHYAKENKINDCIHLGDVFHGVKAEDKMILYDSEVRKQLNNQIEEFVLEFPTDLNVVAITGNHDDSIIKYLNTFNLSYNRLNENYLSILKPNFTMIKARKYGCILTVHNMRISLNHPMQYNMFFPYVKTTEVDKITPYDMLKKYNTNDIDIYISGHYHYNYREDIDDENFVTRRHYEVVPSLSKIHYNTLDQSVGKVLRFIYDKNNNVTDYGFTTLYLRNGVIIEGEEMLYPTNDSLIKDKKMIKKKRA